MSFTNFSTGNSGHSFGGEYVGTRPALAAVTRTGSTTRNLPGEIRVTVDLTKVSCGTEISDRPEGLPEVIPLESCYLGWQESLAQLATLVEPEIPGRTGRRQTHSGGAMASFLIQPGDLSARRSTSTKSARSWPRTVTPPRPQPAQPRRAPVLSVTFLEGGG